MRIFLNSFILFVSVFAITSCGSMTKSGTSTTSDNSPKIVQKVEGCNAIVEVINYTQESDCQYLFKMEDGTLLYPGEMPKMDVPFYQGAGLKIGYEIFAQNENDVIKVSCTKHDYLAKITCMEEYVIQEKGMPENHEACLPIKNPYKFTWMRNAITNLSPTRVNEYSYSIGYLYEFKNNEGFQLFDCLGNRVCATSDGPDCQTLLETLSDPKVILVVNN